MADTPHPKTIRKPPPSSRAAFDDSVKKSPLDVTEAKAELAPRFRSTIESWMIPVVTRAITEGLPFASCAGLIGVSRRTFTNWLAKGEDEKCPDPVLAEFAVAVHAARSQAALKGVKLMNMHAAVDWKAADRLMQIMDPDTFVVQQKSKVDVTHHDGADRRDLSGLTDEELEQLEALEAKVEQKRLPA